MDAPRGWLETLERRSTVQWTDGRREDQEMVVGCQQLVDTR